MAKKTNGFGGWGIDLTGNSTYRPVQSATSDRGVAVRAAVSRAESETLGNAITVRSRSLFSESKEYRDLLSAFGAATGMINVLVDENQRVIAQKTIAQHSAAIAGGSAKTQVPLIFEIAGVRLIGRLAGEYEGGADVIRRRLQSFYRSIAEGRIKLEFDDTPPPVVATPAAKGFVAPRR